MAAGSGRGGARWGRREAPEPPPPSGRAPPPAPHPRARRDPPRSDPAPRAECGLGRGPGPERPGAGRWPCWPWAARDCAKPARSPCTPRGPVPGTSKCGAPLLAFSSPHSPGSPPSPPRPGPDAALPEVMSGSRGSPRAAPGGRLLRAGRALHGRGVPVTWPAPEQFCPAAGARWCPAGQSGQNTPPRSSWSPWGRGAFPVPAGSPRAHPRTFGTWALLRSRPAGAVPSLARLPRRQCQLVPSPGLPGLTPCPSPSLRPPGTGAPTS